MNPNKGSLSAVQLCILSDPFPHCPPTPPLHTEAVMTFKPSPVLLRIVFPVCLLYFAFQPCICCHPSPQAFLLPCLRPTYPAHAMWGACLMRSQPSCSCWSDADKSSALTPLRHAATAHAPHLLPDVSPDMAEASRKGVLCPGSLLTCCRPYNNNNSNETHWEMSACPDKALERRPIPTTVLIQNHWDQWKHQLSAAKDSLLPCLSHFTPSKPVSF